MINLSTEEIPDSAYIFLAKGLGFVQSRKVDYQDLKYDTTEFTRKLAWKAFFKANPELETNSNQSTELHRDIKISGYTYPNFTSPLLDEIKTKVFGWIANHCASTPKENLSPLEFRGRKWVTDKTKSEELFVTRADKGGAILVMNFADVKAAIENELFDPNKFQKLDRNADQQLNHVKNEVKSLTKELAARNIISDHDKTLIAGLNANNNSKCAPEYQPEPPYAYPLFKIHKLSSEDIANKKIPPNRLVHASKFGPLYRMEKWASPYLTKISREYCKEEFILDTGDLIGHFKNMNESQCLHKENVNLFTMDVKALYPSIDPQLALQAIADALAKDKTTDKNTKTAILRFIELSFENSYVTYRNECYKSKVGIPTGGSLSRQIADIFLHWLLYNKVAPKLGTIEAIRFWKRFIDDCVGIWRGTQRSFYNFVRTLNAETKKYGIEFPLTEVQFGKSVHILDLCTYLEEENTINYRGYTKPTDSKRYLNPNSFHPRSVFRSIPYSQFLRTLRNNSKPDTASTELEQCVKEFENSGYKKVELIKLKHEALNRIKPMEANDGGDNEDGSDEDRNAVEEDGNGDVDDANGGDDEGGANNEVRADDEVRADNDNDGDSDEGGNDNDNDNEVETLVFPIHFFSDIEEFKNVLHSLEKEIQMLIGNVRIMFAVKKHGSIGSAVVRNKQLSISSNSITTQRCNGTRCRQCPLVTNKTQISINNQLLSIPKNLNCKSKNIIYLWLCKLCAEREAYFGRTIQESHDRSSGHRACFTDEEKWEKSALSMHAKEVHQDEFSLSNFSVAVIKKVSPQQLRREEFRFIDKYRTIPLGLNRYKV